MKELWFAVVILLVLGILAGIYDTGSVTGDFVANLAPKWDYPTDEFSVSGDFKLDLVEAFFDPDGDSLSFSVRSEAGVAAGIKGSVLFVDVPERGANVWVTASDGKVKTVRKLIFVG